MGEIYKKWLENSTITSILGAYNASRLEEEAQTVLEELVVTQGKDIPDPLFWKSIRTLSSATKRPKAETRDLVDALRITISDRKFTRGGADPHITNESIHRKGLDRPQSLR